MHPCNQEGVVLSWKRWVDCIKNSHSSKDLIDAVNNSVLEVLTNVDEHLTESNDLFIDSAETESKKKTRRKFERKGNPKLHLQQFLTNFS